MKRKAARVAQKIAKPDSKAPIRKLSTSREDPAPVSQIPFELLSRIFTFFQHAPEFEASKFDNFMAWVKVTHVCRRWREVAMACPDLWTNIHLCSPLAAEEMLRRSKTARLVIYADLENPTPKRIAATQRVLSELPRIKKMNLRAYRHILERLLLKIPLVAHRHETRSVSAKKKLGWIQFETLAPKPQIKFKESSISMKTLKFTGVEIDITSPFLGSQLTWLSICGVDHFSKLTVMQILRVLVNLPSLEHLELVKCYSLIDRELFKYGKDQCATLPNLAYLRIGDYDHNCDDILLLISPLTLATTRIRIECTHHLGGIVLDSIFSHVLMPFLDNGGKIPLQTLSISFGADRVVQLDLWKETLTFILDNDLPPWKSLSIAVRHSSPVEEIVNLFCDSIPLHHLQTLLVHAAQDMLTTDALELDCIWARLGERMPTVKHIEIEGNVAPFSFFECLNHGFEGHEPTSPGFRDLMVQFPLLDNLYIGHANFGLHSGSKKQLRELLKLRDRHGTGQFNLVFRQCQSIYQKDIELYRKYTKTVELESSDGAKGGKRLRLLVPGKYVQRLIL